VSNDELRSLAWKRLWADGWFWRLFGGGLLLGLCGSAVQIVLKGILLRLGVQSWLGYAEAVMQNRQDLTTPIPNLTDSFVSTATSSTVLTFFFSWLMSAIAAYGCAVILRRCIDNDEKDWLASAFGGFKMPFGLLWLFVRWLLIFVGWTFVAGLVPGLFAGLLYRLWGILSVTTLSIAVGVAVALSLSWAIWIICIPFYRYRFVWLVKAEHPEWSAGACLSACRKLMEGSMMRSFRLDCSYWKAITKVLLLAMLSMCATLVAIRGVMPIVCALVAVFSFGGAVVGSVVLGQYIHVGQGLLYRDLTTQTKERTEA